jgi:hypothetical protein
MRQLSNNYPNARVRAVDSNGRIVDILWSDFFYNV